MVCQGVAQSDRLPSCRKHTAAGALAWQHATASVNLPIDQAPALLFEQLVRLGKVAASQEPLQASHRHNTRAAAVSTLHPHYDRPCCCKPDTQSRACNTQHLTDHALRKSAATPPPPCRQLHHIPWRQISQMGGRWPARDAGSCPTGHSGPVRTCTHSSTVDAAAAGLKTPSRYSHRYALCLQLPSGAATHHTTAVLLLTTHLPHSRNTMPLRCCTSDARAALVNSSQP
jgi:hypothetical protein